MELKEMTVNHLMEENVKLRPDKTAIEFMGLSYTWKELDIITDHLASYYMECGVGIGTHVGIFSANSINWVCVYIALAKIGAISVLINFNYKYQELLHAVRYARLEYLCYGEGFKEADFRDMIEQLREEKIWKMKQYIYIGRDADGDWYRADKVPYGTPESYRLLKERQKEVKTEDFLSMIFTSGTTAEPKGVRLTHYQMLNVAREAARLMHWEDSDRVCLCLSLFHCFGLSTGLLANLVTGGMICLLPNFRSLTMLEAIQKYRCTILNGVPSMFLAMMNNPHFGEYDVSSVKSGVIAGSGVRRQDYLKVKEAFGYEALQQSYGQTEASPSITFSGYYDDPEVKAVSVGKAIPNVDLRIADPDTDAPLVSGGEGEVQVRGFNVMTEGYYKKQAQSKKAFTKDGWLKTGDLGRLDDAGNLYITGRSKDVIIRCGENISPKEVEEAVMEHPLIEDVMVYGAEAPIVQEDVVACVICRGRFVEEDIRKFLKQHLADYKIPKYFYEFKEFPLRSNGKLDKQQLMQMAEKRRKS